MTVPLRDIERQQLWEANCIEEGIKRFRRSIADTDLADTPAGLQVVRDVIDGLTAAIVEAQQEAISGVTSGDQARKAPWWWLLPILPAPKLAFITLRTVLTCRLGGSDADARTEHTVATRIGEAVRMEIEFERWKAEERAKTKGDKTYRSNLLYAIEHTREHGGVNERNYKRWLKKAQEVERVAWTHDQKTQVGAKLLLLAVLNGGGWFALRTVWSKGKSTRMVLLTEVAEAALSDVHSAMELNRPFLTPMRCPPKPWMRADPAGVKR